MKTYRFGSFLMTLAVVGLLVPSLGADVKTREKTQIKFEGFLGGMVNLFGGSAARDGVTSTVAVKGHRKSSMSNVSGEIVDLSEEKVYRIDTRRKEYRVVTFAQLRAEWEKAKADAEKRAKDMKPEEKQQVEEAGKQLEFTFDVKETGQRKQLAGYDTREVVLTIAGTEKGRTLEDGGGFVMTNTMWLGPRITSIDEIAHFQLKFIKAVYGEAFLADMQQMAAAIAMFPSMKPMMERMQAESGKLQGTALQTTSTFEGVKSKAQMDELAKQQSSGGGGGISGALARRMMGNRGQPQQRTTVFTSIHELLSVEAAASDADVAIPVGFKEKK